MACGVWLTRLRCALLPALPARALLSERFPRIQWPFLVGFLKNTKFEQVAATPDMLPDQVPIYFTVVG